MLTPVAWTNPTPHPKGVQASATQNAVKQSSLRGRGSSVPVHQVWLDLSILWGNQSKWTTIACPEMIWRSLDWSLGCLSCSHTKKH